MKAMEPLLGICASLMRRCRLSRVGRHPEAPEAAETTAEQAVRVGWLVILTREAHDSAHAVPQRIALLRASHHLVRAGCGKVAGGMPASATPAHDGCVPAWMGRTVV